MASEDDSEVLELDRIQGYTLTNLRKTYREDGAVSTLQQGLNELRTDLSSFMYSLPIIDDICFKISSKRLNALQRQEAEPTDSIETAYKYRGVGNYRRIKPMHARPNAEALVEEVQRIEPSVILEIGAGEGGSLYLWTEAIPSTELAISISATVRTDPRLFKNFGDNVDVHLIELDSHAKETRRELDRILEGLSVDLLFIDGDHSYKGRKMDFEMYKGLVREGGAIMIDGVDSESHSQIIRLWNEIEAVEDTYKIKRSEKSSAIGVVRR